MSDSDILKQFEQQEADQPRRRLGLASIVLLVGMALTIGVIGVALARQGQTQPTAGPAPDFTLTTFDGEPFRLSDQRGKIVIMNFWASWCGPCRDEAPALQAVWERYRDRGVVVVGITYADAIADSRAFMDEFGVTYPNLDDPQSEVSGKLYHITGVPETFIIDQDGNIDQFIFSTVDAPLLMSSIERLLGDGDA